MPGAAGEHTSRSREGRALSGGSPGFEGRDESACRKMVRRRRLFALGILVLVCSGHLLGRSRGRWISRPRGIADGAPPEEGETGLRGATAGDSKCLRHHGPGDGSRSDRELPAPTRPRAEHARSRCQGHERRGGVRQPLCAAGPMIGSPDCYCDPYENSCVRCASVYLIGRIVVFEDLILSRRSPLRAREPRRLGLAQLDPGSGWTEHVRHEGLEVRTDIGLARPRPGSTRSNSTTCASPVTRTSGTSLPSPVEREEGCQIGRFPKYA